MKATILVDNQPDGNIGGEWGLSAYITTGNRTILLDTGASDLFVTNAAKLNLPLDKVDTAILSHAHYDHANGMAAFFAQNTAAKFYLRSACGEDCYAKKWIFHRYIGMPRGILHTYADRMIKADGDTDLGDGIYLIPHKTDGLEKIGVRESMYRRNGRKWTPDNFTHEQSLVIDSNKGLIIWNSCSHGGAATIIHEVSATFPNRPIYAMIGGFHLFNKSETEVREFARRLADTEVAYVCTGHCTGDTAYKILSDILGDRLHKLHSGLEILL